MSSKVFVMDTKRKPLNPVHPGYARFLLTTKQAAVLKRFPFTIVLKKTVAMPVLESLRLKIDPGSQTTGMAILNDATGEVVFAAELTHRGKATKEALDKRRAVRRSRRQRKTRYRKQRFQNRRRKPGWLAPSLENRVANILTWVYRLWCISPITALSLELVKFDLQQIEKPEICGMEYQQGELAGYELREYMLQKWGRQCSYCGAKDIPLQLVLVKK